MGPLKLLLIIIKFILLTVFDNQALRRESHDSDPTIISERFTERRHAPVPRLP